MIKKDKYSNWLFKIPLLLKYEENEKTYDGYRYVDKGYKIRLLHPFGLFLFIAFLLVASVHGSAYEGVISTIRDLNKNIPDEFTFL